MIKAWLSKGIKPGLLGWLLYDVGTNAFTTSIIVVFFGPFITQIAKSAADTAGFIYPFGIAVKAGSFYPYIISASVLFQVVLLPLLGAVSDAANAKRQMFGLSAFIGAAAVIAMGFIGSSDYLTGGILFIIANFSLGAADVFYNSFLPDISTNQERNFVSSYAWGIGYAGGGFLLLFQFLFFGVAETAGLNEAETTRICISSSGIWWGLFAIFTFISLKTNKLRPKRKIELKLISKGFSELIKTFKQIKKKPNTLFFLIAFLLYSDGIQTVTSISTQFGQEELGMSVNSLVILMLIVQFTGFFGAIIFTRISNFWGRKKTIMLSLLIYLVVMVYAFGFIYSESSFYFAAIVIALILVGSQAISRAAFSLMIPKGKESGYFGIYEISERGTSWLGPLFFGLAYQFTNSYRLAILSIAIYFLVGIVLLAKTKFNEAYLESLVSDEPDSAETVNLKIR